jgi:hypothetical protein
MRADPTTAELAEHEVETEAHKLVVDWLQSRNLATRPPRGELASAEQFAEWMLTRRPPAGNALVELAERLTPNPALTPAGTLAIILDAIDKIDDQWLARTLAFVNARDVQGLAASPVTDEQWADGDLQSKIRLLQAARNLKAALREASKP